MSNGKPLWERAHEALAAELEDSIPNAQAVADHIDALIVSRVAGSAAMARLIAVDSKEPTPPAASETAKCVRCGGSGEPSPQDVGAFRRCPECHGSGARPNPVISKTETAGDDPSATDVTSGPPGRPLRMTTVGPPRHVPFVVEGKHDASGTGDNADDEKRAERIWERTGLGHWDELRDNLSYKLTKFYRFVRAESAQRIRELEGQYACCRWDREQLAKRRDELEQQLATLKAEKEALELKVSNSKVTISGWAERCSRLLAEKATLALKKEAAEANRAEWIATNEAAHRQAEELLEERNAARARAEAAEARAAELTRDMGLQRELWSEAERRVEAWEPAIRAAFAWLRDERPATIGKLDEALDEIPEELRPATASASASSTR